MRKSTSGVLLAVAIFATACGAARTSERMAEPPAPVADAEQEVEETAAAEATELASAEAVEEAAIAEEVTTDEIAAQDATSSGATTVEEPAIEEANEEAASTEEVVVAEPAQSEAAAGEAPVGPNWYNVELTNVNVGESFRLVDFQEELNLLTLRTH